MLPLIRDRDWLQIKPTPFFQIKLNDIVAVWDKKQLVAHRVIYKTKRYLVTKGDNNNQSDGQIRPDQVVGRVINIKRHQNSFTPEAVYLMQSSHYLKEINHLNQAFSQAEIDYLFLKGLPLHFYYDKTYPRRLYVDCDILIKPSHLVIAEQILKNQGFVKVKKDLFGWQAKLKQYEPELVYCKIIHGFT